MMNPYWKSNIPNISVDGLLLLAQDAEYRIGSYLAGGNPIDGYVEKQQYLLELIQDELENRTNIAKEVLPLKIEIFDKKAGKLFWTETYETKEAALKAAEDLKENHFGPKYFKYVFKA